MTEILDLTAVVALTIIVCEICARITGFPRTGD